MLAPTLAPTTLARGWTLAGVAALCLTGCGEGIPTAEVTGTVTLDGQPLPGVIVQFEPADGAQTRLPPGTGMTNAAGRYVVLRPGGQSGAVVGSNTVRVLHGEGGELAQFKGKAVRGGVSVREVAPGDNVINLDLRSK